MNGNSPWHDMRVDPQSSSSSVGYSMDRFYEGDDRTFKKFYKTTDSNSADMRDKAALLYKIETLKDMRKMQVRKCYLQTYPPQFGIVAVVVSS